MSSSKTAFLDPLRLRVRRFQFTVGLGFFALILGSILSVSLSQRLMDRVQVLPVGMARVAIGLGVQNLWVLGVLPLLAYGAARIIELRPVSTALGAALTGQAFLTALQFVQDGVDGWVERGWLVLFLEGVVFVLGIFITDRAIRRGRVDAERQAEASRQRAANRKEEYAQFLREAERDGDKSAQRDVQKATALPLLPASETLPAREETRPGEAPAEAPAQASGEPSKPPTA